MGGLTKAALINGAAMLDAVKRDRLSFRIHPEQDAVIADAKFVEPLEIARQVLHRSADLLRMSRKPGEPFKDSLLNRGVKPFEVALEGWGGVEPIAAHG